MNNFIGLFLTILIFWVIKRINIPFIKKIPAMFISTIIIIVLLNIFKIDYSTYNQSANVLTLLLGPATIALALPLYENIEILTKHKRAIYSGFIIATITAITSTYIIGKLLNFDGTIIKTLLPKSVTAPIAIEISKSIGGMPEITVLIVALTGLFGAIFGHYILKKIKIKSDTAIGLAIGAASHVLGTSSCIERKKEKQVVMATISLIIIGILTTFLLCTIF